MFNKKQLFLYSLGLNRYRLWGWNHESLETIRKYRPALIKGFFVEVTAQAWPQIDIPFLMLSFRFLKPFLWVLQERVHTLRIFDLWKPLDYFLLLKFFYAGTDHCTANLTILAGLFFLVTFKIACRVSSNQRKKIWCQDLGSVRWMDGGEGGIRTICCMNHCD